MGKHLCALLLALGAASCGNQSMSTTRGTIADVQTHLQRLIEAPDPHAFLVITVAGTSHFFQFSTDSSAIELDFPLITADQKSREAGFRTVCQTLGFHLRESTGSDGSQFLDCALPRDVPRASVAVQRALRSVFGVADSTALDFEGDKLPPAAA